MSHCGFGCSPSDCRHEGEEHAHRGYRDREMYDRWGSECQREYVAGYDREERRIEERREEECEEERQKERRQEREARRRQEEWDEEAYQAEQFRIEQAYAEEQAAFEAQQVNVAASTDHDRATPRGEASGESGDRKERGYKIRRKAKNGLDKQ